MFKTQKLNYTVLFLLFCVASSKGIIIYNEELLVALSFVLFVLFCLSYFGNQVKESLDERTSLMRLQLEEFHRHKEESLQQLLSLHQNLKQVKHKFPSLEKETQNGLLNLNNTPSQRLQLSNHFFDRVQEKLTYFISSKSAEKQDMQKYIALTILLFVTTKNLDVKSQKGFSKQIEQGLSALKA